MTDPGEADFVEAHGTGSEYFEAPALFYLTHADTIRRWAELETGARSAMNAYLESIGEDLDLTEARPKWGAVVDDTGQGYRHFLFSPGGTPQASDESPAIACCFGWNQRRATITANMFTPFVGVRVGGGPALTDWRSAFLDGRGARTRSLADAGGYNRSKIWPVWTQVVGRERWWADLDAYRQQVIGAFETCVETFGDEVERTVGEMARRI
jgi:hypothetical protein